MIPRLFGCVCGQFHSPGAGLGMAAERASVPMPFYVIEHEQGLALFDCGVHSDLANPDDPYRVALRSQDLDVSFEPGESTASRLHALDIDPADIRYVIASHLHFDHAGGLHQLPNATLVVQRSEWEAGADREIASRYFLVRRFFNLGHPLKLVDGEHDLFADGSVVCVPSPGHTPGHQSLRIHSDQGDHILVGDACYNSEACQTRRFPEFSDQAAMNRSLDALLASRAEDTVMVFGHDPNQWGDKRLLPGTR